MKGQRAVEGQWKTIGGQRKASSWARTNRIKRQVHLPLEPHVIGRDEDCDGRPCRASGAAACSRDDVGDSRRHAATRTLLHRALELLA